MGGKPKIQGGMTATEQQKVIQEERNYQKQEELARREAAIKAEEDRVRRETEERARIKAEEEKRLKEMAEAEALTASEAARRGSGVSRGQGDEEEESSISGLTNRLFDFYSALYSGMRRPE